MTEQSATVIVVTDDGCVQVYDGIVSSTAEWDGRHGLNFKIALVKTKKLTYSSVKIFASKIVATIKSICCNGYWDCPVCGYRNLSLSDKCGDKNKTGGCGRPIPIITGEYK